MKIKQSELAKIISEVVKETLGLDHSNRGPQKPLGKHGAPVVENGYDMFGDPYSDGGERALIWEEGFKAGVEYAENQARSIASPEPSELNPYSQGLDEQNNPWAICTDSVGRKDKEKYERCVQDVKGKNK